MPGKGPKCKLCDKGIQIMSYDAAYVKFVKPGQAKGIFLHWECAKDAFGGKLDEVVGA